jgi:hypothetical protein
MQEIYIWRSEPVTLAFEFRFDNDKDKQYLIRWKVKEQSLQVFIMWNNQVWRQRMHSYNTSI